MVMGLPLLIAQENDDHRGRNLPTAGRLSSNIRARFRIHPCCLEADGVRVPTSTNMRSICTVPTSIGGTKYGKTLAWRITVLLYQGVSVKQRQHMQLQVHSSVSWDAAAGAQT